MAKKFSELRKKMSPERRTQNAREAAKLALSLNDLRAARNIVQQELADELGVTQASVSKMLQREDLLVSSLRDLVESMGGELEIRARFGDESIPLKIAEGSTRA